MYKRCIATALAAVMLLAMLAGCGASGRNSTQTQPVQTDPIEITPIQTMPVQTEAIVPDEYLNISGGFKENGAFTVTHKQAADMMNIALREQGLYMGFDGVSGSSATYSVVTGDEYDSLGIWAFASITDESQPITGMTFYTTNDTEDGLGFFTVVTCIACTVADPSLSISDAAELLTNAQELQMEDGSTTKIAEYGDFQFILGIGSEYTMFYIL